MGIRYVFIVAPILLLFGSCMTEFETKSVPTANGKNACNLNSFDFLSFSAIFDRNTWGRRVAENGKQRRTVIIAPAPGIVVEAIRSGDGQLIIAHGKGADGRYVWSAFAPLSRVSVRYRQKVVRGERVAAMVNFPANSSAKLHMWIYTSWYSNAFPYGEYMAVFRERPRVESPHGHWYNGKAVTYTMTHKLNRRDVQQDGPKQSRHKSQKARVVKIPIFEEGVDYSDQPTRLTFPLPCG